MDRDDKSTQMGEEEEEAEADNLKSEEAEVAVTKEAAEEGAKEIETKVKMGLT